MTDVLLWILVVIFGVVFPPIAIVDALLAGETRWHPSYRQVTRAAEPVQFWLHMAVYLLVWAGGIALAASGLLELFRR